MDAATGIEHVQSRMKACTIAALAGLLLVASARPASAQFETIAMPVQLGTTQQVRMISSTTHESQGSWSLETCWMFANHSGPNEVLNAELDFRKKGDFQTPGAWTFTSAQSKQLGGAAVNCSLDGPTAVKMSTQAGLAGDISDACCFVVAANGGGGSGELPQSGDGAHVLLATPNSNDEVTRSLRDLVEYGGPVCTPDVLELLIALIPPALIARRRRGRRGGGVVLGLLVLAFAVPQPARAMTVALQIDAGSTSITSTLDGVDRDVQSPTVTGTMLVDLQLVDDPQNGWIATSLQATGGAISFGAVNYNVVFAPHVSVAAVASQVDAVPGGAVLPATPAGVNTATLALSGMEFELAAGTFTANGTALGTPVNESVDFSLTPSLLLVDQGTATIVTSGSGSTLAVTLTLPITVALLAVDDGMLMPVIVSGQMVLTGSAPTAAPALPATAAVALGLLLLAVLAGLLWRRQPES